MCENTIKQLHENQKKIKNVNYKIHTLDQQLEIQKYTKSYHVKI